jgi:hypothetical protein
LLWLALVLGIPANLIFVAAVRYRYYIPGDPLVDWLSAPQGSPRRSEASAGFRR